MSNIINNPRLARELGRYARDGRFEITDSGVILFPRAGVGVDGQFEVEHMRGGELIYSGKSPNLVTNVGLDHILNILVAGATQVDPWYVFLFENDYTPVAGLASTDIGVTVTECTSYDEAARQTYTDGTVASQSVNNSAAKATFTINASKTVYGAGLISVSTKGATTGTLLCASRFGSSRAVVSADSLLVTYTLTASDV